MILKEKNKLTAWTTVCAACCLIAAFTIKLSQDWTYLHDQSLNPFIAGSLALVAINHMLTSFVSQYFKDELSKELLETETEEELEHTAYCLRLSFIFGFAFIALVMGHTTQNALLTAPGFLSCLFWLVKEMPLETL